MAFDPSGRFKLLDAPYANPGKCGLCGYAASGENEPADKRKYIDFNLDFEYYGALYFCTECMHSLCSELGYALPAEVDDVIDKLSVALAEVARLSVLVEAINGLANYLVECGWITLGAVYSDDSDTKESVEGDSESEKDDSGSAEIADESGSDDVLDSGLSLKL